MKNIVEILSRINNLILIYIVIINIITFIIFGMDKLKAINHKKRIRESTLLGLSFFGGAAGGLLAMYIFRHKTRKPYFSYGLPLMVLVQILAIYFI